MTYRFSMPLVVGAFFVAVASLAPGFVAAQAPKAAVKTTVPAKTWKATRTPDGQPDLQGFWTNTTYTPLQRPKNINKEFFTKEELDAIIKKAATEEGEQTTPGTIPDATFVTISSLHRVTITATPPPQRNSSVLSVRSWRIIRPREQPSAARTTIRRAGAVPC